MTKWRQTCNRQIESLSIFILLSPATNLRKTERAAYCHKAGIPAHFALYDSRARDSREGGRPFFHKQVFLRKNAYALQISFTTLCFYNIDLIITVLIS